MERVASSQIIQECHERRQKAISSATRKGAADLLIHDLDSSEPYLFIPMHYRGHVATFFAFATRTSQISVKSLNIPETPMEMLIYDPEEKVDKEARLVQISMHLPGFLASLHPEAGKLPINIYNNFKDLRDKKPLVIFNFGQTPHSIEVDMTRLKSAYN